eukprot:376464-Pyramimonas_sp.AAC.1
MPWSISLPPSHLFLLLLLLHLGTRHGRHENPPHGHCVPTACEPSVDAAAFPPPPQLPPASALPP